MKNVILTPKPYRDKNFQTVREAAQILKNAGIQSKICLPFEVDRSFELPKDLRFHRIDRERLKKLVYLFLGLAGAINLAGCF